MLSAQAYSFRMKARLAISLSWIGGYVNAVAFLACGIGVSHVTGSTTTALLRNVEGQKQLAGYAAFAVAAFFAGTLVSAVLTEGARRAGWRSKYVLPVVVEALLLTLVAEELRRTGPSHDVHDRDWWALVGLAAGAMGLQNATITRVSGNVIRTTHMTGVVTDLGLESVQLLWRWRDHARGRPLRRRRILRLAWREPSVLRLALLVSIFGSFTFGAGIGAAGFYWDASKAMLVPVAFMLWIVWVDVRSPIADVQELASLESITMEGSGSLRELLPKDVGVFRLTSGDRSGSHRAPDFAQWAETLPAEWRIVVLCFHGEVVVDENAVHGLREAVTRLRRDGRSLVLAGIAPPQYAALEKFGAFRVLSRDDVWSDVEFALARAASLAETATA